MNKNIDSDYETGDSRLQEGREAINTIDQAMAQLFVQRMEAAQKIAAYKRDHGLPVYDGQQEKEILAACAHRVSEDDLQALYLDFQAHLMALSRAYQEQILRGDSLGGEKGKREKAEKKAGEEK